VNPASVDTAVYADMKKHYTEAQIIELGAFIAFNYGMDVFMRTLGNDAVK
jgi:alkylhydroperoxidase family enzyme